MARGKAELTGFEAFLVKTIYGFADWSTLVGDAEACRKQKRAEDGRKRNNDRRIRNNLQQPVIRLSVGEKRESDGLAPITTASVRSVPKILKKR